ncbi:hypothetical protein JTB14_025147 [Gonioctena quinquepunctata]|nr:hypothetical protein JTB14_025147 [Gonioctena quinquepunctata]
MSRCISYKPTAFFTMSLLEYLCLSLRIQQLTLCYGAAMGTTHHPNYNIMYSNESLDLYESRTTITRPAKIRMKELLELYNEELPIVYSTQFCEIPPWKLNLPTIHKECAKFKKSETNPGTSSTGIPSTDQQISNVPEHLY